MLYNNPLQTTPLSWSVQVIFANLSQTRAYHSWSDPTATDKEDGSIPRHVIIFFDDTVYQKSIKIRKSSFIIKMIILFFADF